MLDNRIILVGGGGHCRSVIDVIEAGSQYTVAGIVDVSTKVGRQVFDYPILGTDADLPILASQFHYFLVCLGQLGPDERRRACFEQWVAVGLSSPVIVSPRAYVSPRASLGAGTVVMHGAVVNAGAMVGENCILNSNSLVEHDAQVGSHVHVSTGAIVNGGATVGMGCFIGSRAVVRQGIRLGDFSVVGAGALVLADTEARAVYVGTPARKRP